jgi:hypothetical protein
MMAKVRLLEISSCIKKGGYHRAKGGAAQGGKRYRYARLDKPGDAGLYFCMSSGARLEKLTIENFGGIKHLEMDVSPFTVLIGPQSVGKSITAKVLYFLRSLPWILSSAAERDNVVGFEDAGRSFYSQVQRDAASFFRSAEIDRLISRFGTFLARLKERSPLMFGIFKTEIGAKVANELLGGIYLRQGNEDIAREAGR